MRQRQLSIAKITRPKITGVYERTRLFNLLDQRREKPVVWISGPAGSGKTTLVGSYLDSRKLPCLWYQVDEGDGDIATFFYYMGLAAKKAAPRVKRPLPLLTPEYAFGIPTFTRRFFEELCSRVPSPFVLVFDNYHEIPEQSALHDIIKIGLSSVPEGVKVIVISRTEPPAGFATLRAKNQMEVIGWDDLSLTLDESVGIAQLESGKRLSSEDASHLHKKAGGWAAGLILMAKGTGIADEPHADGALRPEETFDFFATELLDKADEPVRDFLLRTAVLPRMRPSMAEKLTKNKNAGAILAGLNRRNYFTEKRDDSGPTYQYHPLFRQFLQSRAGESFTPAEHAGFQVLAAELLERDGSIEDAAELYQAAGDSEGLARMIVRHAPSLIGQGRYRTLDQWITSALSDARVENAWLLFWRGECSQPTDPPRARKNFERALELFQEKKDNTGELLAWSGIVETFTYEWNDFTPLERWIRWLDGRAKKGIVYPSAAVEARVSFSMAAALMIHRPAHPRVRWWWERALTLQRDAGDVSLALQSLSVAAGYYFMLGDIAGRKSVVRDIHALARMPQASPLAQLTWKWLEAAIGIWALMTPDQALGKIMEALAYAEATGVHVWDHMLFALGVYGSLMKDDLERGREFIGNLERTLAPSRRHGYCHYHYLIAWERLLAGDFAAAKTNAETALNLAEETGYQFPVILCSLELVQALLGLGSAGGAAAHAARAHDLALRSKSVVLEYMALLAKAQVALSRGHDASGLRSLREGLRLGREQGYVNQLWWRHPPSLSRLCARALDAGIEVEYVRGLITRHRLRPDRASVPPEAWPWPVKVLTLGRFRLEAGGKPLTFSGKVQKKPLDLLKALIAFGGDEVTEGQITDALWPEAEGDAGRLSFKSALHRLRQLLGADDAVVYRDGRVGLDPRLCWVDAWAFERMLESSPDESFRGQAALGVHRSELMNEKKPSAIRKHQSEILQRLERALQLYTGEFLSGEPEQFWMISPRERLREKFLRAVLLFGSSLEQAGNHTTAIEWYRKALDVDHLAEEFHQRLMVCYQKLGRMADAVKVYERCRKTLAAGLGVEPSKELEALYRSLLRK